MNRLDRFVVVLVFLVTFISAGIKWQGDNQPPRAAPERRPVPDLVPPAAAPANPAPGRVRRPKLSEPSAADPLSIIEIGAKVQHGSGTAFPVSDACVWMTARHVIDGCLDVYLIPAYPATVAYAHPSADVAILIAARRAPGVVLSGDPLQIGQDGFSFGFPAGKLGAAHGQLMGRSRMQFNGRMSGVTPTLTWAEIRRVPDELESLGGISGGPVFDEQGRLIGMHVGGSKRRGRTLSVAPEVLLEMRNILPPRSLLSVRPGTLGVA